MSRPSPVDWGPRPFRARDREILDYIDSIRPVSGIATMVADVPGGRAINAAPQGAGGGGNLEHPFQLINESEVGSIKIRVRYGTLKGIAPSGMSVGDDPTYVLSGLSSSGIIWLGLTRDTTSGAITSRYIDKGTVVPDNTSSDGYFQIGSWVVTDGTMHIAQAISGSIDHQYCGGVHLWGSV